MGFANTRRQSLSLLLRRSAKRHRDKVALVCGAESLSYSALDDLADSLARGLRERGIRSGDRVAILARNSHAFVAVRFAVARIGAVLVPVNFMLGPEEVRYILDHSGAQMLFVDGTTWETGCAAASRGLEIYGLPGEHTPPPEQASIPSWTAIMMDGVAVQDVADAGDL
ncbi:MAG TPA: AMP-binding protein, partial [Sphingobium sp.]|nr:AMP-binding protein [Sphingobium sp.]